MTEKETEELMREVVIDEAIGMLAEIKESLLQTDTFNQACGEHIMSGEKPKYLKIPFLTEDFLVDFSPDFTTLRDRTRLSFYPRSLAGAELRGDKDFGSVEVLLEYEDASERGSHRAYKRGKAERASIQFSYPRKGEDEIGREYLTNTEEAIDKAWGFIELL